METSSIALFIQSEIRKFDFKTLSHDQIGKKLGMMDLSLIHI